MEHVQSNSSSETPASSKKLRSLEKSRKSTCPFADNVALEVLKVFRHFTFRDDQVRQSFHELDAQTCLSAIVIAHKDELTVCSIGAGTKILPEDLAKEDTNGTRILDSHAEVLARRGFVVFLYKQYEIWKNGGDSLLFVPGLDAPQIRPNLTFHLYCSSAPCGNACVRRWAKGKAEVEHSHLGACAWPKEPHSKFLVHSPLQTTVLCKVSQADTVPRLNTDEIPLGTALPDSSNASARATCSDKIARWMALGLEGSLLKPMLKTGPGGIKLSTVIVGRKFSRLHLERAVCCRLGRFWKSPDEHPTVLCTSVKLQEGGREAEAKAVFTDYALVWWHESVDHPNAPEVIVPSQGLKIDGDPSTVARCNLYNLYRRIAMSKATPSPFDLEEYNQCKLGSLSKEDKLQREELFTKYLKPWPQGRYKKDS